MIVQEGSVEIGLGKNLKQHERRKLLVLKVVHRFKTANGFENSMKLPKEHNYGTLLTKILVFEPLKSHGL